MKYWGLGNERRSLANPPVVNYVVWGPWQVGFLNQTDYAKEAKNWAHGSKLVDPTIKLISCGNTGSTDWDREVL